MIFIFGLYVYIFLFLLISIIAVTQRLSKIILYGHLYIFSFSPPKVLQGAFSDFKPDSEMQCFLDPKALYPPVLHSVMLYGGPVDAGD